MSQYHSTRNEQQYGSARSPSRTQRDQRQPHIEGSPHRLQGTLTQRLNESPSKYDIQFYQRKVNRLENDLSILQDELSLTKFKLSKADDYERKYEIAFTQNQNLISELDLKDQQTTKLYRQIEQLLRKNDHLNLNVRVLEQKVENEKRNNYQLKDRHEQHSSKTTNQGKNERANIEESYNRQLTFLKQDFRAKEQNLKRKIQSLQIEIQSRGGQQKSLKFKLQAIKKQKNQEIDRLKGVSKTLRDELSTLNNSTDLRVVNIRTDLINQNEIRIENVRKLANDIEQTLLHEIQNLNQTLGIKNSQIQFILQADRKFMDDNEQCQNGLKGHIQRLQDQIFIIQRQDEVQLFKTIDRLQNLYNQNLATLNDQFDRIRQTHQDQVDQLNRRIKDLQKENELLSKENLRVEGEHKKLAGDKEQVVNMLSQKIISLQSAKDLDLKHYTTSMKEIELDAKAKIQDLHTAIQGKNTQFEILNAQLALKNQQIIGLISEIDKVRGANREKMSNLESKNAAEQNMLGDLITGHKKEIQEFRRNVHELQSQLSDKQAQFQLKINLLRQDLQSQKQANELLQARNNFLVGWCKELETDLKSQRVSNVNILHDTNISRRQTVQTRQQVRVELEAIKDKEVQQIRNIFKLEKNRLEADLLNKQHLLRQKKQELARLLMEYKKLENKVGKPSKFDKGAQENGKCKATLNAEILLTQNILNAINRQ